MHYVLCKDDNWTQNLKNEITADFTKKCFAIEGFPLIKIPDDIDFKNKMIAFSSTAVINAIIVPESTVSNQVKGILKELLPKLEDVSKINFHVYALTQKYGILETGRADIFKGKITTALKKKGVYGIKSDFDRTLPFLQILILPNRTIALSFLTKEEMPSYHSLISPFVGGFNNVEDDIRAPSRAFKKIVEAQELIGHKMTEGETVVDLGASPGGWTYVAVKNGAKVIALDRSPLQESLMESENVVFKKEDAFKYTSDKVVDWVISDIICAPERILELINYWVVEKNCKNFVFTIKFQGQKDYGTLKKFKQIANEVEYNVILKQLNVNKNEITIMGSQV
jgi:23S rRNA (cytidine2498-2'-O)-methyltransferase